MIAISKDKSRLDKLQYMKFLKYDAEELTDNYVISRKEAKDLLKTTDLVIRITRINVIFLYTFCLTLHVRVLYNAIITLPVEGFIFSTIPNFLNFYLVTVTSYQSLNCFFSIYLLTCHLILKSFKTSTNRNLVYFIKKKTILNIANLNLKAFNQALRLQELSQKDTDLNLTTLYSMMISVGFAFPYVIITADGIFDSLFYLIIYINALSISLGAFAAANNTVRDGVSYETHKRKAIFKKINKKQFFLF